jgi:hypothetical protein
LNSWMGDFNSWRQGGHPEIAWQARLPSDILQDIAADYGAKVFIGIKGGEAALREMPREVIYGKQWQISTTQPSPQWISGDVFARILDARGAG